MRKRVFKLLDDGRKKPVTWVAAPAGSGKTTLVASWLDSRKLPCLWYQVDAGDGDLASFFYYMGLAAKKAAPRFRKTLPLLTPEYLPSISVFTRRYFEELFSRLSRSTRFCIVLDNYQDAPEQSGFHEMLAHAIDVLPEEAAVIIVSRSAPAPPFARLIANNCLHQLGWEDIHFTFEESSKLLAAQGKKLTEEAQHLLYEKTEGWAAGLVLMRESAGRGELQKSALPNSQREVFDYFASEIFDKSDKLIQDVLLKTAFLPKIDPTAAAKLTGIDGAGQILEKLSRYNYFTQRYESSYQYHPLFREFLLTRARSAFSLAELSVLQRHAAELLADAGSVEESVELLRQTQAWDRICELVEAHAPAFLAEGRNKTIETWLRTVPEDLLRQMPWALYWRGSCRLAFDQIEARGHYEAAYRCFKDAGDIAGIYLAWAGIADSFIYLWDDFSGMRPWLSELQLLQQEHPRFPSEQVEARVSLGAFSTMYYMDPGNPTIERWRQRVETLMRELPDPNFKCQAAGNLVLYYLWHGTRSDLRRVVQYIGAFRDHPEATPLSRILACHAMAISAWQSLECDSALALCEEGLQIAEQYGVHMMDPFLFAHQTYAYGYRNSEPAVMGPILDRMRACLIHGRRIDVAHYHHLMAWYLSLCGRYEEALTHCREAAIVAELSAVSPTAFVHINTAQVLFLAGRPGEAETELEQGVKITEQHKCALPSFGASFVRSALAIKRGNREESRDAVRRTFELASRFGYLMYSYHHPAILQAVCAFALREGIESDYAVSMIRNNGLEPPDDAPEAWPWPLKITTLGRLELRKDDKKMTFAGKKKQLELLKIMIAAGGRAIREEQVTDILWPEAEGDDAHNNFKMTLSRLRAMIGNDAIAHDEGLYSLNTKMVRVDVREFEQLCDAATRLWGRSGEQKDRTGEAAKLTSQALDLYQGHFLPEDGSCPWVVSLRERLRSKFVRLTLGAGSSCESQGKWKTAAGYYEKGLEADRFREEFYQRLMLCHHKLGQRAEVMMIYERCCIELSALGVVPTAQTKSIYETAM